MTNNTPDNMVTICMDGEILRMGLKSPMTLVEILDWFKNVFAPAYESWYDVQLISAKVNGTEYQVA